MINSIKIFKKKYISEFSDIFYIFIDNIGFIVWRIGTGNNIELLHIKSFVKRKGYGSLLLRLMILELSKKPPYYSIFGFALYKNKEARFFYKKNGFNVFKCPFPYKTDSSIIFSQSFKKAQKLIANKELFKEIGSKIKKNF